MARDDDDDRPRTKKRSRDDEDDDDGDDDERPRSRRSREERDEEDDDDRPRKKKKKKMSQSQAMPGLLLTVIIVSMIWGGLGLLSNCWGAFSSINGLIHIRNVEQIFGDAFGGNMGGVNFVIPTRGFYITLAIVHTLLLFAMAGTFGGGILLIMRKSFGRYPVMVFPALAALVDLGGIAAILILTRGSFLGFTVFGFIIGFVFAVGLCILNVIGMLNKNVVKSLE